MIYYNIFMKKCSLYFIIFIIIVIIALSGWFSINGDFEKEEAKALKDKLNKGNQKIEVELSKDKILEKPAKKVVKKKEEFVDDIDYLEKISESEE